MDGQVSSVKDHQPGMLEALSMKQTLTICIFLGRDSIALASFPKGSMTFKKKVKPHHLKGKVQRRVDGVEKTQTEAAERDRGRGRQEGMDSFVYEKGVGEERWGSRLRPGCRMS